MSDYTPTTEQVRRDYSIEAARLFGTRICEGILRSQAARAFDRWLAEHDRQVKAELIADMIEEAVWCGPDEHCEHGTTCHDLNAWLQSKYPYRNADE